MTESIRDPAILGKTIQFKWTEGPTTGTTHEHVFHEDGTVEWRDAERSGPPATASRPGGEPAEKPAYAAIKVAERAYMISYLAGSGYTLTAVLNFGNQQLSGFASSATEWHLVRGTFEVVK